MQNKSNPKKKDVTLGQVPLSYENNFKTEGYINQLHLSDVVQYREVLTLMFKHP